MICWFAFFGSQQNISVFSTPFERSTEEECSICILGWIDRLLCSPSVVAEHQLPNVGWELLTHSKTYTHSLSLCRPFFLPISNLKPQTVRKSHQTVTKQFMNGATHKQIIETHFTHTICVFLRINWLALARPLTPNHKRSSVHATNHTGWFDTHA